MDRRRRMDNRREGDNGLRRGFSSYRCSSLGCLPFYRHKVAYNSGYLALSGPSILNEYSDDHSLSAQFALSAFLGFFVGLLRVNLELTTKRGDVLGLCWVLSELSQSSTFSSRLFLYVFALIFFGALEIFFF